MSDLEIQLKRIQEKLQAVLKLSASLQKENQRLKDELVKNKNLQEEQNQKMDDLRQQIEVFKITSGNWDENDKKHFEKRINTYIKEIDRCIVLLSE